MNALIRSIGLVFLFFLSAIAHAQWTLPVSGCSIKYAYDDAGNRTARFWYCWSGMVLQDTEIIAENLQMEPIEQKVEERVLESMRFDLFPNPTTEVVTITLTGTVDQATYDVYDVHGRRVLHGTMHGSRLEVATTSIPSGLYHFCLIRGQEMLVRSFVVEH